MLGETHESLDQNLQMPSSSFVPLCLGPLKRGLGTRGTGCKAGLYGRDKGLNQLRRLLAVPLSGALELGQLFLPRFAANF